MEKLKNKLYIYLSIQTWEKNRFVLFLCFFYIFNFIELNIFLVFELLLALFMFLNYSKIKNLLHKKAKEIKEKEISLLKETYPKTFNMKSHVDKGATFNIINIPLYKNKKGYPTRIVKDLLTGKILILFNMTDLTGDLKKILKLTSSEILNELQKNDEIFNNINLKNRRLNPNIKVIASERLPLFSRDKEIYKYINPRSSVENNLFNKDLVYIFNLFLSVTFFSLIFSTLLDFLTYFPFFLLKVITFVALNIVFFDLMKLIFIKKNKISTIKFHEKTIRKGLKEIEGGMKESEKYINMEYYNPILLNFNDKKTKNTIFLAEKNITGIDNILTTKNNTAASFSLNFKGDIINIVNYQELLDSVGADFRSAFKQEYLDLYELNYGY